MPPSTPRVSPGCGKRRGQLAIASHARSASRFSRCAAPALGIHPVTETLSFFSSAMTIRLSMVVHKTEKHACRAFPDPQGDGLASGAK
jgi:hypothetical protein